jgi:dTDP-D-glucose 4,6-dehydratase
VHYNSLGRWGHLQPYTSKPHARLQLIAGDVAGSRCVTKAVEGRDILLHLAALIGIPCFFHALESYVSTNIRATQNVFEANHKLRPIDSSLPPRARFMARRFIRPLTKSIPLQGQSPENKMRLVNGSKK